MKFVFSLVLILFALVSSGQITIGSTDMPSQGDTLRYSTADVSQVLSIYQNTGVNYTWDFTSLIPTGQDLTSYLPANKTPYGLYFMGSFGVKVADSIGFGTYSLKNIYNFFRKTTSSFEANGMGMTFSGIPLGTAYLDNDEIYKLPLSYPKRDSTTFHFKTSILGQADYEMVGYRINEVDGWGTVKTPFGTFQCVRVKTTIMEVDSFGIMTYKFGFPNNRIEYKWLAKGIHIPVMQVSGTLNGASFTPNSVQYRDIYRNIVPPKTMTVDFTADNLNPGTGDIVSFLNQTQGIMNTYNWSISPYTFTYTNSTDSTSESPFVIFNAEGYYTIKLAAKSLVGGYGDTTKKNYIYVVKGTSKKPFADFSFSNNNPAVNEIINISDMSVVYGKPFYSWSITPSGASYQGGTDASSSNPIIKFTAEHLYTVRLIITDQYGSDTAVKTIQVGPNGINHPESASLFQIYPLPATGGKFTIRCHSDKTEDVSISIFDLNGKIVLEKSGITINPGENNIPVEFQNTYNYYILSIQNSSGKFIFRLF